MKTLEEECFDYLAGCIPKGASPEQIQGTKFAFHAGVWMLLQQLREADENEDDDFKATHFTQLESDCIEFQQKTFDDYRRMN